MRWNEGMFGGKVLSEESLKAAFTPVKLDSGEEPMMSYGYGWMIGERRGLKTISHGGGLHGWLSLLTRFVDQNTTVVVLHNAMPAMPGLVAGRSGRSGSRRLFVAGNEAASEVRGRRVSRPYDVCRLTLAATILWGP